MRCCYLRFLCGHVRSILGLLAEPAAQVPRLLMNCRKRKREQLCDETSHRAAGPHTGDPAGPQPHTQVTPPGRRPTPADPAGLQAHTRSPGRRPTRSRPRQAAGPHEVTEPQAHTQETPPGRRPTPADPAGPQPHTRSLGCRPRSAVVTTICPWESSSFFFGFLPPPLPFPRCTVRTRRLPSNDCGQL